MGGRDGRANYEGVLRACKYCKIEEKTNRRLPFIHHLCMTDYTCLIVWTKYLKKQRPICSSSF